MIQSKQELIDLLPSLYKSINAPVFLINEDKNIIIGTEEFLHFNKDYFQNMINEISFINYKIYTYLSKKEVYFLFPFQKEEINYICIGPYLTQRFFEKDSPSSYSFLEYVTSPYTLTDLGNLPYLTLQTRHQVHLIYQMITGQSLNPNDLKLSYQSPPEKEPEVQSSIDNQLFEIREDPLSEYSYAFEQRIKRTIMEGKSVDARLLLTEFIRSKKAHRLSQDGLTSTKYNTVAAITLFTRHVIEAGVPVMKAYSISDIYIRKIDATQNVNGLYNILFDAVVDFTRVVKRYRDLQNPQWVKKCKEYISRNLHQRITLDELAQEVSMNTTYLSAQFKKITGISIKEYINQQKVKEVQFLLKTSNYTLNEISVILDFASQSHMTQTFKNVTGQTPLAYKNSK